VRVFRNIQLLYTFEDGRYIPVVLYACVWIFMRVFLYASVCVFLRVRTPRRGDVYDR